MKLKMKKFIGSVLCLVLACAVLSACSSSEIPSSQQPADSGAPSPSGEKITIRIVHDIVGTNPKVQWLNEYLIPRFEAEYGNEIELELEEIAGENNMVEKMKVYLSTNQLPDVTPYGVNLSYDLAVAGKTLDLTPYIEAETEIKEGLSEKGLQKNSYDGKIFGLPATTSWMWMYGNKDLFDRAGVDTEFSDWDDFWSTLDRLRDSGVKYPVSMETAGNAWTSSLMLGGFVAGHSEEGFRFMNTAFPDSFNLESMKYGIENTVRLLKNYAAPDAIGGDYATAEGHFMREESALLINGTWVISHFSNPELVSDEGFADKIVSIPFPDNMIYKSAHYGSTICSQDKEHADAAWKWLRMSADAESQAALLYYTGELPDNVNVKIDEKTAEKYPLLVDAYERFGNAKSIEGFSRIWSAAVGEELATGYPAIMYGSMTAEQLIERLDAVVAASK